MASILSASADAAFLAAVGEDTNNNSAAKIEPTNQQSDQENTNWSGSEEAEIGFLEQNNNKIGETSTTTTNNNNTKSSNNKDTVHDIPPKKGRTQSATVGENDSTTATVASLTTSPETPSEFVKESVAIEQELVTIEEEEPTQLDDSEPNADGDDDDREGVNHPSVAAAVGGTAAADADAAVTTECGSGEDVAIPARPVKRARTAFFVFSDDRRATVQTQVSAIGGCWCSLLASE